MAIGVAIIGGGIFAREQHLPAVQASPLLELKAVYSRSLASAQSVTEGAPSGVELYSDEKESKNFAHLLQRDDIQAVILALPIPVQPEYIKLALAAGKHVLAEKPIAKDVATAQELLEWYRSSSIKATFSIAENFRFLDSLVYGASEGAKLGRVLNFRGRVHTFTPAGSKYYETPWRKTPTYQGGFLLDGGIHFVAATRFLLGPSNQPARISAYTNLVQEHLPPVDTVDSIWKTTTGATGTLSISFGTTLAGSEYEIAFENGTVIVGRGSVTVKTQDGSEHKKEFPDEGSGVKQEVKAWAESLQSGTPNPRQSAEEGFKDLKVIEAMLQSGENNGAAVELKL